MEKIENLNWKPSLLKIREKYYLQNFRAARDFGVPRPTPYNDKTANGLTRCVCDFLKFSGHYSNRINSMGIQRRTKAGEMRWSYGATNKGTADIDAIINGVPVKIEIKIGNDRMSEAQFREQERVQRAGGQYIVVSSMDQFFYWYQSFTKSLVNC